MTEAEAIRPRKRRSRFGFLAAIPLRRRYYIALVVLAVALAALIAILLALMQPVGITVTGGDPHAGIKPVFAMYGPGSGKQPLFHGPMASAWGPDGRIYVADSQNNRIVAFDAKGRYLFEFGSLGIAKPLGGNKITWEPGRLNYPTGVATNEKGDIFVADFNNDSISVFDSQGQFLRRFPDPYRPTGRGGSGAGGGGIAVTAVAVMGDKVYATDAYQVLVFDSQGELLQQFGRPGVGPDGLDHPNGIAVDADGRIYVSDSNQNRVTAFSPAGEVLWTAGAPIKSLSGQSSNPFILPRGLTVLSDGSVLVADPLAQKLIRLTAQGMVSEEYGERGTLPGQVNFPNGAAANGKLILVTDKENNRVQVVELLGK